MGRHIDAYFNTKASKGLLRADGKKPYNDHFYPMPQDQYDASEYIEDKRLDDLQFRVRTLSIIGLEDGRWMAQGFTYKREFFDTRQAALRTAAARQIRLLKYANRRWKEGRDLHVSRLPDDLFLKLVDWVYQVLGKEAPSVYIPKRPEPKKAKPIECRYPLVAAFEQCE